MKHIKHKFFTICFLLILSSCVNKNQVVDASIPGITIPLDKFNTYIKLSDSPEMANTHKNNDDLTLRITNLSDSRIIFPDNYGVKIFVKDGNSWSEVQNNSYNTGGTFVLPTKDEYPLGLFVNVLPYLKNMSSPNKIRIVIVGHVENNESEQVGAYIDLDILP